MKRYLFPLIFGIVGVAILLALGNWQLHRLAWKEDLLARIEQRIADEPVALPKTPDPESDRYLSVRIRGRYLPGEIRVLGSLPGERGGPGFRIVKPFQTEDGRRILVDRGMVPQRLRDAPRKAGAAEIVGNLDWPRESDSFTPEPDLAAGIWFARDVPRMAAHLKTEPVLVVVRKETPADPGIIPVPVSTRGIPNNHLNYAITWFLLALGWAGMTGLWLWRIRQRKG